MEGRGLKSLKSGQPKLKWNGRILKLVFYHFNQVGYNPFNHSMLTAKCYLSILHWLFCKELVLHPQDSSFSNKIYAT